MLTNKTKALMGLAIRTITGSDVNDLIQEFNGVAGENVKNINIYKKIFYQDVIDIINTYPDNVDQLLESNLNRYVQAVNDLIKMHQNLRDSLIKTADSVTKFNGR